MAISRLISSIYLGLRSEAPSPSAVALLLVTTATPTAEDTWCVAADGAAAAGLHIHSDGAMLDLSGGPLPCPPSIRQEAILCHVLTYLLTCFILGTDVNVKEVQMEISAF